MTLKELYTRGTEYLDDADITSPSVDAFYLLEYLTGIDRTEYLLNKDKQVSCVIKDDYQRLIWRRSNHEPYQYITGEADFAGFKFKVTPDVLIPRLDSEVLLEEALKLIKPGQRILDMCTGSGCLAIALKKLKSDVLVSAADISEPALKVAQENAINILQKPDAVRFIRSDLFGSIPKEEKFDIIISNPPYVTDSEYTELDKEVRDHEPALALKGGADGLDIYKKLIPDAAKRLDVTGGGGYLLLEIGYQQAGAVSSIMSAAGFADIKVVKDLAGLDRVVSGRIK